jgi:protocatechuate 3,4-dioxygenase beta subunit
VKIASELDRTIEAFRPRRAVGYVVLLPEGSATRTQSEAALRRAFKDVRLRHVFLTIADRVGNDEDVRKYAPSASPGASTSIIVYVNRTAESIHQELGAAGEPVAELRPALGRLFAEEEPHKEMAVAMCSEDEPGEKLEFYGRVLDEHGNPLPKASVIAYNTDATGLYVPRGSESRSPRINGVAVTNADGWYRFRTIRPGGYPNSDDPQHIHLHIDAAVHQHTYRTLWFEDDPRLTPAKRRSLDSETVVVPLRKRDDGVWTTRFDVRLGGS